MGRRHGTPDARVLVAISSSMAKLRRTQGVLNGFWQTSELAYGYLLSHSETLLLDPDRSTIELLGNIESAVWFPNNQGRIKLTDTISTTLKRVRENTIHTYRATLLSFFSAFEDYLDTEVENLKPPRVKSWGEYVRSLSHPKLRDAKYPIPLHIIMCADFSRLIRNKMVHDNFCVPHSLTDPEVTDWKNHLLKKANEFGWPNHKTVEAISYAANQVVGQAVRHVQQSKADGKDLPIELFYMLFSFTNLDSLAFAIEEALQPIGIRTDEQISRKQGAVRRDDLIIGPGK